MAKLDIIQAIRSHTFVGWLVIEALSKNGKVDELINADDYNANNIDVRLVVNGIELPLEETLEFWKSQYDASVNERAEELLDEKLGSLFAEVSYLEERLRSIAPW